MKLVRLLFGMFSVMAVAMMIHPDLVLAATTTGNGQLPTAAMAGQVKEQFNAGLWILVAIGSVGFLIAAFEFYKHEYAAGVIAGVVSLVVFGLTHCVNSMDSGTMTQLNMLDAPALHRAVHEPVPGAMPSQLDRIG